MSVHVYPEVLEVMVGLFRPPITLDIGVSWFLGLRRQVLERRLGMWQPRIHAVVKVIWLLTNINRDSEMDNVSSVFQLEAV